MSYKPMTNEERQPLISSGPSVVTASSPESIRDDEATSSASCRQCLTSYVPIEPLLLGYTLSRVFLMGMTTYYLFDQASLKYGDPSMDSLNPCGSTHGHHKDKEKAENVQREFVQLAMISAFSASFTAVIPTMFIGPLTDRVGRRIGFVLPLLGNCARALVFLFVLGTEAPFYVIYIGNVLDGLGGGFGTFLMTSFSAAADVSTPGSQRALRICIIEVVNILGASAGGIAGGRWRKTGYVQPVMCAAAIGVVCLIYALWFWPETRHAPPDNAGLDPSGGTSRVAGAGLRGHEVVAASEQRKSVVTNYGAVEDAGSCGGLAASQATEDDVMGVAGNVGINHGDLVGASHGRSETPNEGDGGLESSESSFEAGARRSFENSGSDTTRYQSLCQMSSGNSYRDSTGNPSRFVGSQRVYRGKTNSSADGPGEEGEVGRGWGGGGSTVPAPTSAPLRSVEAPATCTSPACCSTATLSAARRSWSVYFREGDASHPERRRVLALCFFSFLLTVVVNFSKPSIEESFRMSDLCWNAVKDSEFSSAWLVAHWLCILLVQRVLQRYLHVHDVYLAMIGCVSGIAALFVFCFATLPDISDTAAEALVYASAGCGSLARALIPMLRSMSSSMVNKDEQGALFVSYACVELAGAAVFDMVAGQIFKVTVHVWPGVIFVIWIFFLVAVMALLMKLAAVFNSQEDTDSERGVLHQGIEHRAPRRSLQN
ncbi:hypothetical protein V1264_002820 [Littorina saxatilis]